MAWTISTYVQGQVSEAQGVVHLQERAYATLVFQVPECLGQPGTFRLVECVGTRSWPFFHTDRAEIRVKGGVPCQLQPVPDTGMRR